jgi:hypothetical protein
MRKPEKKEVEKELRDYKKEYEEIKARLLNIGFIYKGNITERRLPCGNPKCACHQDPNKRHGPYYQISWKEKGKTISFFLSGESLNFYRKGIQNRISLLEIIEEMEIVSRRAGECIRTTGKQIYSRTSPKQSKKNK